VSCDVGLAASYDVRDAEDAELNLDGAQTAEMTFNAHAAGCAGRQSPLPHVTRLVLSLPAIAISSSVASVSSVLKLFDKPSLR
jgi:hypothetical protein